MEDLEEKKIDGEIVYDGKLLEVHKDKVLCPSNKVSYREYINKCKAAVVVCKIDDKFVLERQFRYPFKSVLYEFPAGKQDKNEDTKITAIRELEEETGYKAKNIKYLGSTYPSPAYTNEIIDIFYCNQVEKGQVHLDENEFVDVIYKSKEEILEMISQGQIKDSKTCHAFFLYLINENIV